MFKSDCRNLIALAIFLAIALTLTVAQTCNAQYAPPGYENTQAPGPPSTAPMLPSAPLTGYMAAPSLSGHTNGTIGPPGMDATFVTGVEPAPSANNQWIALLAVAVAAFCAFLLGRRKKSCVWALGASTAAIMMIAGLAWGTFGIH